MPKGKARNNQPISQVRSSGSSVLAYPLMISLKDEI